MTDKWKCNVCKYPKLPNPNDLKVGDTVNYTVQIKAKNTVRMSSKSAVIKSIHGDEVILYSKGKFISSDIQSLTPEDAPSPLTYIFGACKCDQESTQ